MKTALACMLAVVSALALDPASLKPSGYVNDFAGVLDTESKASLEQYCGAVEKATGAQFALVTVNSLDGTPIEDFANTLFRQWGVGKKGENGGALLLLAVGDRKSRIEVGYGLEPTLTDGFTGSTLRAMRPMLRAGNYGAAIASAAQAMGEKIAEAKGVSIPLPAAPTGRSRYAEPSEHSSIPIGLIVFIIFFVLMMARRGGGGGFGGFLTGMLLGNVLGRGGGGGFGGGGFGGSDSDSGGGGGFGGFGGGDSGGGGASSDW